MGSDWQIAQIEEIAEKVACGPFGSSIKVSTFVETGVPVISGQHLHGTRLEDGEFNYITTDHAEKLSNANVYPGDVVFTHAGNIGQAAFIPENSKYKKYVLSQRQFYLRPNRSLVIPEFVAYYFHSPVGRHQLLANASQTGVPSIAQPVSYLKSIKILIPPLFEQRAIAHILGSLDDKIELNRRMNQTLEATARAIFKSWFVDFDPVRVKAEGGDPGLPDDVAVLFPDRLEDSELGEVPKGWNRTTLEDGIEIHDSKRIPLNKRQRAAKQGTFPYYGAAGIMDYVNDYLFDGVYVLAGEDGSVTDENGYPVVQYVWGQFWVNNHAHVLKGNNGICDEHLYLFLKQKDISAFVTGAVQPKLSQTNLKAIPFILPDEPVSYAFSELTKPLFSKLRANSDENRTLASLRDTLLPKLISGELQVPETEKFVEGVGL